MTGRASRPEDWGFPTPTSGQEPSMSDKPISDLRRRMIADMTVRTFSDKTQHDYIRQVEAFARFLGRSPDTATGDDIRRFQLAQVEQGAQPPKMNTQPSALPFFLTITLGRADLAHQLARTHYPRRLPRVLTLDQVARLLEAAPGPGLKYKAALGIAYGAGLGGGEVVMLRVSDIDSERMLIRVEMGKCRKVHHAMMSPQPLSLRRAGWLQYRSKGGRFPGRDPLLPMTVRQLNRVCHMAAEAAGLGDTMGSGWPRWVGRAAVDWAGGDGKIKGTAVRWGANGWSAWVSLPARE